MDIQTASDWERSIMRGLETSDWFLVVMSSRSVDSDWVRDELHWAVENRAGRIIPVQIDNCNPRDFHIRMGRLQLVDFRTPAKDAYAKLLDLFEK